MAINKLFAYLNKGFDEDFITSLSDYIKNKPGTKLVALESVNNKDGVYDLFKIERENHLSLHGGTSCRLDPPEPNVTVNEYGDWLCDIVDNIM